MKIAPLITVAALATVVPAQTGPVVMTEPESGVSVLLPEEWSFTSSEKGLIAASKDKEGALILARVDRDFAKAAFDLRSALRDKALKEVELDRISIVLERDRGALDGLVEARGSGLDQTGDQVDFELVLVKVGDDAELVLGAWKNPRQAVTIAAILASVHIRTPDERGGALALSEPKTGASIRIPEGWVTMADRRGLLAVSKDRGAMALIFRPRDDFDAAVEKAREFLGQHVFDDVQVGQFGIVEAIGKAKPVEAAHTGDADRGPAVGRMMAATGTGKDRHDDAPVKFRVLAIERSDTGRGALILGAWKSADHQEQVDELLRSIRLAKPTARERKPEKKQD